MKKLLSLALILMVCCTSALMLGCSSKSGTMEITGTTEIAIAQTTIDDEMAYIDAVDTALAGITIVVKDIDGTTELYNGNALDAKNKQGASITGFSLKTAGTRTATVTMLGVTETFEYTVTVS